MTQRSEITETADVYAWDALQSPTVGEMIYRRRGMLVFAQYDKDGGLREATLRRMVADQLTTVLESVGWTDRRKVGQVTSWLKDFGETAAEARDLARRQRARQ